MATEAPALAIARAVALPMPVPPPVTIPTLPFKSAIVGPSREMCRDLSKDLALVLPACSIIGVQGAKL